MAELKSRFFLICQPGLENELLTEIKEFWPFLIEKDGRPHSEDLQAEVEHGGISLECSAILGYQINFFSKLASRVLLRLDHFRVRDFPKLVARLKRLKFDQYLNAPVQLEVQASKSRLNNEKRIIEIAKEVWPLATVEEQAFSIFVRMYNDECTVSIDTSGAHLHFRVGNKHIGEAPLRETMAAFMLRRLCEGVSVSALANIHLLDPMAGSGTLLSEARYLFTGLFGLSSQQKPRFAFQNFINCPKILKSELLMKNYPSFLVEPISWASQIANDIDEDVIPILRKNLGSSAKVLNKDCFLLNREKLQLEKTNPLWVICNPPYGQRLRAHFKYSDLGRWMSELQGQRIGILLPSDKMNDFCKGLADNYKVQETHKLNNGGMPVEFQIFYKSK